MLDVEGFVPPPKSEPPVGAAEPAVAFPKIELVAGVVDDVGLGVDPAPKSDPVVGGFCGFIPPPKIEGVVPDGAVFKAIPKPPAGVAVDVAAGAPAVFPKSPAPPPNIPPPVAGVVEEAAVVVLMFPNILPPVAGAPEVAPLNKLPPAGLAMVHDFRARTGQRQGMTYRHRKYSTAGCSGDFGLVEDLQRLFLVDLGS